MANSSQIVSEVMLRSGTRVEIREAWKPTICDSCKATDGKLHVAETDEILSSVLDAIREPTEHRTRCWKVVVITNFYSAD